MKSHLFKINGLHRSDEAFAQEELRAVICQKLISVEGNGHCCHRPSSKLGNQLNGSCNMPKTNFCRGQRPLLS